MPRYPKKKDAKQKIADVIKWAERQGFRNVAAELRAALDELADPMTKDAP